MQVSIKSEWIKFQPQRMLEDSLTKKVFQKQRSFVSCYYFISSRDGYLSCSWNTFQNSNVYFITQNINLSSVSSQL